MQSSGDMALDALALDALKKTGKVAPLPDHVQSKVKEIEAHLTFSFAVE